MKKHSSLLAIFLCITILITFSGCASQNLRNAKACVDNIFELTTDKADLESELQSHKKAGASDTDPWTISLEGQIDACDMLIEQSTEELHQLFDLLSAEEQQEIKAYTTEVFGNIPTDIWN